MLDRVYLDPHSVYRLTIRRYTVLVCNESTIAVPPMHHKMTLPRIVSTQVQHDASYKNKPVWIFQLLFLTCSSITVSTHSQTPWLYWNLDCTKYWFTNLSSSHLFAFSKIYQYNLFYDSTTENEYTGTLQEFGFYTWCILSRSTRILHCLDYTQKYESTSFVQNKWLQICFVSFDKLVSDNRIKGKFIYSYNKICLVCETSIFRDTCALAFVHRCHLSLSWSHTHYGEATHWS